MLLLENPLLCLYVIIGLIIFFSLLFKVLNKLEEMKAKKKEKSDKKDKKEKKENKKCLVRATFCLVRLRSPTKNQAFQGSAIRSLLRNTSCPYNPCCIHEKVQL